MYTQYTHTQAESHMLRMYCLPKLNIAEFGLFLTVMSYLLLFFFSLAFVECQVAKNLKQTVLRQAATRGFSRSS